MTGSISKNKGRIRITGRFHINKIFFIDNCQFIDIYKLKKYTLEAIEARRNYWYLHICYLKITGEKKCRKTYGFPSIRIYNKYILLVYLTRRDICYFNSEIIYKVILYSPSCLTLIIIIYSLETKCSLSIVIMIGYDVKSNSVCFNEIRRTLI